MGGKEEQGRIKAAWYLKMGNTASLPEAGEGQAVSSLKGGFFCQLHLGSFSPKKTGLNQHATSGPFHTQNTSRGEVAVSQTHPHDPKDDNAQLATHM